MPPRLRIWAARRRLQQSSGLCAGNCRGAWGKTRISGPAPPLLTWFMKGKQKPLDCERQAGLREKEKASACCYCRAEPEWGWLFSLRRSSSCPGAWSRQCLEGLLPASLSVRGMRLSVHTPAPVGRICARENSRVDAVRVATKLARGYNLLCLGNWFKLYWLKNTFGGVSCASIRRASRYSCSSKPFQVWTGS